VDGLGIPWLSFSAATGGWTLAGFAVFCVIVGWLIPRWVVALLLKRIDAQDLEIKELIKQNSALTDALKISNDAMSALKRLAESGGKT
jgi:hypothetical protein